MTVNFLIEFSVHVHLSEITRKTMKTFRTLFTVSMIFLFDIICCQKLDGYEDQSKFILAEDSETGNQAALNRRKSNISPRQNLEGLFIFMYICKYNFGSPLSCLC